MLSRRELLKKSAQLGVAITLPTHCLAGAEPGGVEVNDVQSQLNPTVVNRIVKPKAIEDIQAALMAAERVGRAISVAGGRHAMGGQQFGRDTIFVDMKPFARVISFDRGKRADRS